MNTQNIQQEQEVQQEQEKKKIKRITFDELVARKLKKEKEQLKSTEIYIESMEGTLVFQRISEDVLLDIMDEYSGEKNNIRISLSAARKLIYLSCPMLQSPELHKELGLEDGDPFDVPKILFDFKETTDLGVKLLEFNKATEKTKENEEKTKN